MTARPVLELRDLAVGHGARALVRDVCLAVRPGQIVALVGPNGSGKTTILRTVAGQLRALGGTVELVGRPLGDVADLERARTMSVMLTGRPRTELLTCRDVVEAGRYPFTGRLGILGEADREAVRAAMEATGVAGLAERDFGHVSDGQRQRVLLARALCQEPRVLLLDEPTSYLDVRSQLDVLSLLRREARERGVAVVASLHEIELAQKAADHVICIRDGGVLFQGAPDEVFTEGRVAELYGLEPGTYDPAFGSVELPRPSGDPEVFVVAGGGTGAPCLRALARAGTPFAAGVLHEHDADGLLARRLAVRTVTERDFEPVGARALAEAREVLLGCRELVCCVDGFGTGNARNAELLECAREAGIPARRWRDGGAPDPSMSG
ncbi:ABC transporter ATP-binding protein [Thermophilibacter mediterraneus]|uniref:ABC transporter ATP-binding protein n=1 Tax=Thermophilibacter mediterraneus TaxID=1871031 RepID=UPI003209A154